MVVVVSRVTPPLRPAVFCQELLVALEALLRLAAGLPSLAQDAHPGDKPE